MYLHELGDDEASFTKEDMQLGKHQQYEIAQLAPPIFPPPAKDQPRGRPQQHQLQHQHSRGKEINPPEDLGSEFI